MSSDLCGDLTVVINSTLSVLWSELPSPYFKFPGTVPAYLRSDGEALLPWIITLIVILVHLPVVVLRVEMGDCPDLVLRLYRLHPCHLHPGICVDELSAWRCACVDALAADYRCRKHEPDVLSD